MKRILCAILVLSMLLSLSICFSAETEYEVKGIFTQSEDGIATLQISVSVPSGADLAGIMVDICYDTSKLFIWDVDTSSRSGVLSGWTVNSLEQSGVYRVQTFTTVPTVSNALNTTADLATVTFSIWDDAEISAEDISLRVADAANIHSVTVLEKFTSSVTFPGFSLLTTVSKVDEATLNVSSTLQMPADKKMTAIQIAIIYDPDVLEPVFTDDYDHVNQSTGTKFDRWTPVVVYPGVSADYQYTDRVLFTIYDSSAKQFWNATEPIQITTMNFKVKEGATLYDKDVIDVIVTDCSNVGDTVPASMFDSAVAFDEDLFEWYCVDEYKAQGTYPEKSGQIFAGWYTDGTCTKAYEKNSGVAYAKFVDENVLRCAFQITGGTTTQSQKTDMRMVTTVDSLDYREVGFNITVGTSSPIQIATTTVYKQIFANGALLSYQPSMFSDDSAYFLTVTLANIPNRGFQTAIQVQPYWITADGTKVVGKTSVKRVANMLRT